MDKVNDVYRRMFRAEESGDQQMAKACKKYLDALVSEREMTRDQFLLEFKRVIKPKKCYDVLKDILSGSKVNEIDLSVEISSLLTHSFLAVDGISLQAYEFLDIEGQLSLLRRVLRGEVDVEGVQEYYKELLQE